jgi:hypothetical protein
VRWIDTDVDRARWRTTLSYRPFDKVMVGVEFNPAEQEFVPIASLFLMRETQKLPAAFLGTSSDRIGSPEGTQCYYLTSMKNLVPHLSAYATVNYSEWDREFNLPFGADLELGHGISVRPMYDGHRTHMTATLSRKGANLTFLWAWLEEPGVSVSMGF